MATTLACVESREVLRCDSCKLVQYRTTNSLCRKCHRPLDIEEPAPLAPQLVTTQPVPASNEAGLQVAGQVREIRRARHLSQRQLAGRMQVPRTYISKIENGKAIPTLGSLERLANALEVEISQLVRDARSRREEEVAAILAIHSLPRSLRCCPISTRSTAPWSTVPCATWPRAGAAPHNARRQAGTAATLCRPDTSVSRRSGEPFATGSRMC